MLSFDVPSGVDTTTGTVNEPAIKAATMTLALPKEGLRPPGVEAQVGELHLADISVPPVLYAGLALALSSFRTVVITVGGNRTGSTPQLIDSRQVGLIQILG